MDEALAEATKARSLAHAGDPESGEALVAVLVKLNRPRDAIAMFDEVVAARPLSGPELGARGQCKEALGDLAGAAVDYDQALGREPRLEEVAQADDRLVRGPANEQNEAALKDSRTQEARVSRRTTRRAPPWRSSTT